MPMDDFQQRLLTTLRAHGPLTAEDLAELLLPPGRRFSEDWDLSPISEIEMGLDRACHAYAVEQRTPNLWYATTTERAAELRAFARSEQAAHLRGLLAKRRAGTLTNSENMDLLFRADALAKRREVCRSAALPLMQQIAEWNRTIVAQHAAILDELAKMREWDNAPAPPRPKRRTAK